MQLIGKLTPKSKLKGTLTSSGSLLGEIVKPAYIDEVYSEVDKLIKIIADLNVDIYATKEYVDQHGGKIDSISLNGIIQAIDENKHVDLTIPVYTAGNGLTLSNDNVFALDELIIDCGTSIRVI